MVMCLLLFASRGTEEKPLILHRCSKMRALAHEGMKGLSNDCSIMYLLHFRHQLVPQHILVSDSRRLWHGVISSKVRRKSRIGDFGISLNTASAVPGLCPVPCDKTR